MNNERLAVSGYKTDQPDKRDFQQRKPFVWRVFGRRMFPSRVDLRWGFLPIEHQGRVNSCSGNASTSILEYHANRKQGSRVELSRLFTYYHARRLECLRTGERFVPSLDRGAYLRDVCKALNQVGSVPENLWPYEPKPELQLAREPAFDSPVQPGERRVREYRRLNPQDIPQLIGTLANGNPVLFGTRIFQDFIAGQTADDGLVRLPPALSVHSGSHAMFIAGYDRREKYFIVGNSWGPHWGFGGYCFMPFSYFGKDPLGNGPLVRDAWLLIP